MFILKFLRAKYIPSQSNRDCSTFNAFTRIINSLGFAHESKIQEKFQKLLIEWHVVHTMELDEKLSRYE